MNKYPLDAQGIADMSLGFIQHDNAMRQIITTLTGLLQEALEDSSSDNDWYEDAEKLVKTLSVRKNDFETHRFNQSNGHSVKASSPYQALESHPDIVESDFGGEMSEAELASHFKEKPVKKKKEKKLNKMSLEEITDWEKKQDNSNDIYKVNARIKNIARQSMNANLTAQGDMVVNSFTHVCKAFYDFAETVQDKDLKIKLIELTRRQEEVPAGLLSALGAGVNLKK